jgi:hypothetical protein
LVGVLTDTKMRLRVSDIINQHKERRRERGEAVQCLSWRTRPHVIRPL